MKREIKQLLWVVAPPSQDQPEPVKVALLIVKVGIRNAVYRQLLQFVLNWGDATSDSKVVNPLCVSNCVEGSEFRLIGYSIVEKWTELDVHSYDFESSTLDLSSPGQLCR